MYSESFLGSCQRPSTDLLTTRRSNLYPSSTKLQRRDFHGNTRLLVPTIQNIQYTEKILCQYGIMGRERRRPSFLHDKSRENMNFSKILTSDTFTFFSTFFCPVEISLTSLRSSVDVQLFHYEQHPRIFKWFSMLIAIERFF